MFVKNLLIHELAEKAKTTVRTIRYYTDEGLLPQPIMQGKYAYYTSSHANRLELIQIMKNSYLPLKEIRQIMLSLSDEEVSQRLQSQGNPSHTEQPQANTDSAPKTSGLRAMEYISHLLDEQSVHRPKVSPTPVQIPPIHQNPGNPPVNVQQTTDIKTPIPGETWQHIPLIDGVELLLHLPASHDTTIRIEQLITFAKKIFS